jgi:cytochrome c
MKMRHVTSRLAVFGLASLFSVAAWASDGHDPALGRKIFAAKCSLCHSLAEHQVGPALAGVVGRKAGSAAGYGYTEVLENAGYSWDAERLNAFLGDPVAYLPGTAMSFGGLHQANERKALICYLAQQSAQTSLPQMCQASQ